MIGVGQKKDLDSEADVLVDEVMALVIKLEDEIENTEKMLLDQKETAGNFKSGLHTLRRQQLQLLHSAVDVEHSSCTIDIQELDWHVNFEKRQVAGLERRHRMALEVNLNLRKDIDFYEESKPLLAEKSRLEENMLQQIDDQSNTAGTELRERTQVLKTTEKKHETAIGQIDQERTFIRNDLAAVRKELEDVKQAIVDAKAEHEYMVEKKARSETQTKKNKLDKQLFDLKSDNTKAAIRDQNTKNSSVNGELDGKHLFLLTFFYL